MPRRHQQRNPRLARKARQTARQTGAATTAASRGGCASLRRQLASESARIMRALALTDFSQARRKAVQRLGIANKRCWPDNAEIQAALQEEYRLFQPEAQQRIMATLQQQALAAMNAFGEFNPRLVGSAMSGTASLEQGISLHLFTDDIREIVFRLIDRNIPWQEGQCQKRYADGSRQDHPTFTFVAGEVPVELIVMPTRTRQNPPVSPITDRPERGHGLIEVEKQLTGEQKPPY
jgi:hypothetical protein